MLGLQARPPAAADRGVADVAVLGTCATTTSVPHLLSIVSSSDP